MPRSLRGGRHELGQNFLIHTPSITTITDLVRSTGGPILELGAGDGALTRHLASLGRPLTAIEIDEHRARKLAAKLPAVKIVHGDALAVSLAASTIVGNIPFHLTTPILRRLLRAQQWQHAILLTQWEVARKRAGVGGGTMMTAQHAPWYRFALRGRVPRSGFAPAPSVDGGILTIDRRAAPLIPAADRRAYERFVAGVFAGRGGRLERIVQHVARVGPSTARAAVLGADARGALPRDLIGEQWADLWAGLRS
ncbi:MAG: 23S ribosomal RNA methyltransferase Erm [Microbacterium enclense]